MSEDLPIGWSPALVADIVETNPGKPPADARAPDELVAFLPMTAVGTDGSLSLGEERPFGDVRKGYTAFANGDVIVAKITPCFENGKAAVVKGLRTSIGFGSSEFHVLRPTAAVLAEYVYHFLHQERFRRDAKEHMTGTAGQARVPTDYLTQVEIPLPPLAEQRRIVEKIDALLAQVNAVRDRLAKGPGILKRFRQSVLAAACSGRLTEDWRGKATNENLPEGWHWEKVGNLAPKHGIFDGPFGSSLKTVDYTDSGVRVIRLENLGSLRFIEAKRTYISEGKFASLAKHEVREGDILVASFVEDDVRAVVLPRMSTRAIAKADCFCIRPDQSRVDVRYLAFQIASRESHDALHGDIHGATRPRITTKLLRELSVRLCSLEEQQEIVRRVEALFLASESIDRLVAAATARADKITHSILAKAFRGELVPTEAELARIEKRDFEDAATLLARMENGLETATPRRKRSSSAKGKLAAVADQDA